MAPARCVLPGPAAADGEPGGGGPQGARPAASRRGAGRSGAGVALPLEAGRAPCCRGVRAAGG